MNGDNKKLVLAAMVVAVAMLFIDQTIVALAIPNLQRQLHLSPTGAQWIVNGYLLALSALFALGGRVADMLGHRRTLLLSVSAFAIFSALCGATPTGSIGESWLILFRVLQGASAAFIFPAALAIVAAAYPVEERGRALAVFFSISGGLTAIGPIAGGYVTEWTWRSIFWINVPVAVVAIALTLISRVPQERHPARVDVPGAVVVSARMGLSVFGSGKRVLGVGAVRQRGHALLSGCLYWLPSSGSSFVRLNRWSRFDSSPIKALRRTTPCCS